MLRSLVKSKNVKKVVNGKLMTYSVIGKPSRLCLAIYSCFMGRYTGLEQIKGQRYADWCDTLIQDKPLNSSQSDENMYMYISMNSDL